jgi:hypothetical protein
MPTLEALFERANHNLRGLYHGDHPMPEGIVVGTRWRRLVDRYVNREIGICLYLRSGDVSIQPEAYDLAFVFQKSTPRSDDKTRDAHTSRESQFRSSIGCPRADKMDFSVSILPCPVVEDGERPIEIEDHVLRCEFASVVRLYSLNNSPVPLREWKDLPTRLFEFFGRGTDRKLQGVFIGGRIFAALKNGCLINAGIKRRAQLIQKLTEIEGESHGQAFISRIDPDAPCPVIIHAYDGLIGAVFQKTVPCLCKDFFVTVCAFDALPTILEASHDLTLQQGWK